MTDPAQTFSSAPTASDPSGIPNSYVNDYQPPMAAPATDEPTQPVEPAPIASEPTPAIMEPAAQPEVVPPAAEQSAQGTVGSEALEDQNIFELLGVMDGSDEEKEQFLDELQQVIWEDFLENDVALLITQEEYAEVQKMVDAEGEDETQKQEKIIVYLEKIIPDLEEIMLEKALELKEDMVRERIAGMREYYNGQTEVLATLDQAEAMVNENKWASAARTLNGIS